MNADVRARTQDLRAGQPHLIGCWQGLVGSDADVSLFGGRRLRLDAIDVFLNLTAGGTVATSGTGHSRQPVRVRLRDTSHWYQIFRPAGLLTSRPAKTRRLDRHGTRLPRGHGGGAGNGARFKTLVS
jgi:hypothetical protein